MFAFPKCKKKVTLAKFTKHEVIFESFPSNFEMIVKTYHEKLNQNVAHKKKAISRNCILIVRK